MTDDKDPRLALFELYLATAEKVALCRSCNQNPKDLSPGRPRARPKKRLEPLALPP
jgi:hypothetical protein